MGLTRRSACCSVEFPRSSLVSLLVLSSPQERGLGSKPSLCGSTRRLAHCQSGVCELEVFDNLTLLKLWCEDTPKAIFPDRRIGRFREGYEASFLVLAGNPIEQFDYVTKIVFRMKQGHVLQGHVLMR